MPVSEKDVTDALSELLDPVTGKNYVESKSAKNVKVEGDRVSLDVVLGYIERGVMEQVSTEIETLSLQDGLPSC